MRRGSRIGVLAGLLSLGTGAAGYAQEGAASQATERLRYTRIYADSSGESHFADEELLLGPVDPGRGIPPTPASSPLPASSFTVFCPPAGADASWHPVPYRLLNVILSGRLEVEVSDGETRRFGAGSLILGEDTGGRGHLTRVVGDERACFGMVATAEAGVWDSPPGTRAVPAWEARPATGPLADSLDAPVVIPLETYVGRLRSMEVEVGGDTLTFLFDTGGGETLVTPRVAAALGCTPRGRSVAFRMSGERVEFSYCPDVELGIGGFRVRHPEIAVWDLMGALPPELPPLGGLVSLESFEGRLLTLDLSENRLTVETPESFEAAVAGMRPLRARIANGMDGSSLVPFVAVAARGIDLWFELDSGNLDDVLLSPAAASTLALRRPEGAEEGERWDADGVTLAVAGLGPVPVDVGVEEIIYDGALSAEFMERWVFALDLGRGRIWARPRAPED